MAGFATLPTELQEQIAANCNIKDLSSLSRTCKYIRNDTLPFIYSKIAITWTQGEEESPVVIGRALRSLLENDSLALLVRQLHFHAQGVVKSPSGASYTYPDVLFEIRSNHDLLISQALLDTVVRTTGIQEKNKWEEQICDRRLDVIIALVVLKRIDLEWLEIDAGLLADNTALPMAIAHMFRKTDGTDTNFHGDEVSKPSLRRVDMGTNIHDCKPPRDWRLRMRMLLVIMQFPQLEELHAHFLRPDFARDSAGCAIVDEGWEKPPNGRLELPLATCLTTLRLIATSINPMGLDRTLSCTPSLTYLEYDYYAQGYERYSSQGMWSRYGSLDGPDLRHALERVRSTLQYLIVSITPVVNGKGNLELFPYNYLASAVGSLKDFQSPRSLSIALPVLCGNAQSGLSVPPLASLLTANLKELCLTGDLLESGLYYAYGTDELLGIVEQFVAVYWETMLSMKKLNLDVRKMYWNEHEDRQKDEYDWMDEHSERVEELCNQQGLDCEIRTL